MPGAGADQRGWWTVHRGSTLIVTRESVREHPWISYMHAIDRQLQNCHWRVSSQCPKSALTDRTG
jgi:hypothetical protein